MTSLHVASWNVGGLAQHLGETRTRPALDEVVERLGSPDVLCLQEVQLREGDREVVEAMTASLPGYAVAHSLADDPKNATFRGGRTYGVATFVARSLRAKFLARGDWDREGRMSVVLLDDLRLAIVNVYAVNGTAKPYYSHELGRIEGDRHGWKRRFHSHVADTARALRQAGYELVLVGDWNVSQQRIDITPRLRTEEPHATSRAHFHEVVVEGLDVVDVFRELHPDARAYTWFNRRARGRLDAARVDFALASRSLAPRVTRVSIAEDLLEDLGGDHVPLQLELDTR